jgi:hypothetical protein
VIPVPLGVIGYGGFNKPISCNTIKGRLQMKKIKIIFIEEKPVEIPVVIKKNIILTIVTVGSLERENKL